MDKQSLASETSERIYRNYFGLFPLNYSGEESLENWSTTLKNRQKDIYQANWEIAREMKKQHGENSNEAVISEIFAKLTRPTTQIALDQLNEKNLNTNHSWEDTSPSGTFALNSEIDSILSNTTYTNILNTSTSLRSCLEFLHHVSTIKDEDELLTLSLQYEELCRQAINQGEPIIYTSYFVNGFYRTTSDNKLVATPMFELTLDLIFPPSNEIKVMSDKYNAIAIKNMEKLSGEKRDEKNNIIGLTVASAGMTVLSQTAGMALDSGGFLILLNGYKKDKYGAIMSKALEIIGEDPSSSYLEELMLTYFHHEHGHNFFPGDNGYDEIQTDIPTLVALLSMVENVNKSKLICFALAEFIPEITNNRSGNPTIDGYINSAVFLVNKLLEHRMINLTSSSSFTFDLTETKVNEFNGDIMNVHAKLLEEDVKTQEMVSSILPSDEAIKLAAILA